jgi:hypothetical protein
VHFRPYRLYLAENYPPAFTIPAQGPDNQREQFMKSFMIALAGAAIGFTLVSVHWPLAALIVFGPMMAVVVWWRPELGLYLFFFLVVMLTDSMAQDVKGIFAIRDPKVVQGLPPLLICFFLAMSLLYFFKLYLIDHKRSVIPVRYGGVLMVILLIATGTGLVRGWDHIDLRVDFMNVIYPHLCFYLCANVLDTRQKIYRMLGVLFLTSVIDACLLDAYYLLGHGWPYSDENAGFERIVTYNATDLMVFIAMIITIYSVSTSGILTGWRRVFAVVGCLPMVFAVLFSFRRGIWVGTIASLAVFYLLRSEADKRRTHARVWVGVVMLTIAILFAGPVASIDTRNPLVKRALSLADSRQSSNQHHFLESQQTLKDLLSSNPILGLGLGSTHSPVLGIGWAPEKQPTRIVHNTYLLIWMKLGLPGLLFFVGLGAKYTRVLLRYREGTGSSYSGPVIAGTGSLLGLWFVLLLVGPVLPYWYETFTIALFAAMTLLLIWQEQLEETNNTTTPSLT